MGKFSKKFKVGKSIAGFGLFSNENFSRSDFVIEYTGELITEKEAEKRKGKYLFDINSKWCIDGKDRKNISRYINHSCRPNCEAYLFGKKVLIYAKKKIHPGEELTYNYGKEYFEEFIKPNKCRCHACQSK
jgi:hypothetical protein